MHDPSQWPLEADTAGEEAYEAVIGITVAGRLLVVVYTPRGDGYRVASARNATLHEARLYWRRQ